ncbi:MAG: hypothetical protein IPJ48_05450 [Propionivibrio sp.]|uniref:Uncharacterized protein n=1 Tax=Candidatus Propionivibrio dominans TaxID=2954373 RepID=A0A9D7F5W5_9RHOO|nr:hypothetical protein [Candidatus Propionivibrio dominans]
MLKNKGKKLHHQGTTFTKGHQGKAIRIMPFLVNLCVLGVLVVKHLNLSFN